MNEVSKIEQTKELAPADPMASMIERVLMDPNIPIERLERLMQMQERLEEKQAEKEFAAAKALMQSALPVIQERGKITNRNDEVQSTYPLWEDVNDALREPLSVNGLAMSFDRRRDGERVIFGCILSHVGGHKERAEIDLPRDDSGSKNAVQGEGSTVSYGQRYSSKMLINWISAGSEDDDGVKAGAVATVSPEQFIALRDALELSGMDPIKFHTAFGHKDPKNADLQIFPASRFDEAIARLQKYSEAKNG